MKKQIIIAIASLTLTLAGCSGSLFHDNSGTPQQQKARAQLEQADELAHEYLICIAKSDKQNPASLFHNDTQRRDVIMNDCAGTLEKVSINAEQAYSNECMADTSNRKTEQQCDTQSVARGKQYTDKLQQEASKRIHSRDDRLQKPLEGWQ